MDIAGTISALLVRPHYGHYGGGDSLSDGGAAACSYTVPSRAEWKVALRIKLWTASIRESLSAS